MKQDSNTAIDSLLRHHARRARLAPPTRDTDATKEAGNDTVNLSSEAAHLDADELAAFAENTVPAAARSRYVAHLIDCDACRHLVINLAGAEAFARASERELAPQLDSSRANWRDTLAAFFAPRGLRFVTPALAALAVGIILALIASVAMRRSRNDEVLVASRQQNQGASAPTNTAVSESNADTATTALANIANQAPTSPLANNTAAIGTSPTTTTASAPAKSTTNANALNATGIAHTDIPARNSDAPTLASGANASTPPIARAESQSDDDAIRIAPQNSPRTAPAPPSSRQSNADTSANSAGFAEERNTPVLKRSAANAKSSESGNLNNSADAATSATKPEQASSAAKRRARASVAATQNALPAGRRAAGATTDTDAVTPARRVSGREFRRQGNVWFDTAYTSTQQITNVGRGSEQYRALIADEPGIGKIAEQLDGEIIVVWKRRAYRIR